MSIRGLARHRDLYTTIAGDQELDDFERWISAECEQPGNAAIDRLLRGSRLKREDWHSLARLVAAQDLRTPSTFLELMDRWGQQLPGVLDSTMRESIKQIERAKRQGIALHRKQERNEFSDLIKVSIERSPEPNAEQSVVQAEMTAGRRLWIASMRHLLTGVAETLCDHQWSIAEPAGDTEWPLTDHPVLKLNYYGPGKYDFRGGWGKPGSEIMMALSPRHLLFVHIGKDAGRRITFSNDRTLLLQRFLVERAHRWVFATQPMDWILKVRPRRVGPDQFAAEKAAWERWHQEQSRAETSS